MTIIGTALKATLAFQKWYLDCPLGLRGGLVVVLIPGSIPGCVRNGIQRKACAKPVMWIIPLWRPWIGSSRKESKHPDCPLRT